jgi:hypothetical protein
MSKHVSISPNEAVDRFALRELVEAYANCADRRDAKGHLLRAVYPLFRISLPNQVIRADDSAWAMVDVVLRQTLDRQGSVLENRDIRAMIKSEMPVRNRPA